MKPSSLATVLIRLVALYIIITGVFMAGGVFFICAVMNSMFGENSVPSTINGSIFGFNFPASSMEMLFTVEIIASLFVIGAGILLYRLSHAIGLFIGRGLEPQPVREPEPPAPVPWKPRPTPRSWVK